VNKPLRSADAMITLTQTPFSSSTLVSLEKPPAAFPLNLKPLHHSHKPLKRKKIKRGICRAEFSHDAPFVIAIGTCMFSSLVLATPANDEEDAETVLDSTDARLAVMGIISFIPYFNWLSWVFAWLDTGKRRYAVYSLVYLVPYLRSNLSLSPEESWLPIASIIFCIVHIQLEASIRNGDLQGFQLFSKASEYVSSMTSKKEKHWERHQEISKQEGEREDMNLPSAEEQSSNEIRQLGVFRKPAENQEQMNGDSNDDERKTH
ncbi:Zinc finger matrin-type protein, partial [Melia azedarach]